MITLGAWVRAHPEFVLGTNEAGRIRQLPPVLAVEVAGVDEPEAAIREVVVLTPASELRLAKGDRIPIQAGLPDLAPGVAELFVQLDQH